MADSTIENLAELAATPTTGDLIHIIDDPAGTPTSKKISIDNFLNFVAADVLVFTNKSYDLGGTGNVLTGSAAEFNTALQTETFSMLNVAETFSAVKTFSATPVFNDNIKVAFGAGSDSTLVDTGSLVIFDYDEANVGSRSFDFQSDATSILLLDDSIATFGVPIDVSDIETATVSARDGSLCATIADSTGIATFVTGTVLVAPVLGTPASGALGSCTVIPMAQASGILPDANMPNLTGDVTTVEGAVATTIVSGAVDDAMLNTTDDAMLVGLEFMIDGGGSAITTGVKGCIEVPFNCTIERQTTLIDQSGSIVIDIWKDTFANFPPTVADTITASAKPTISSAVKDQDATLTGWTTAISEGDILYFNVDSITTAERCLVSLKCRKT